MFLSPHGEHSKSIACSAVVTSVRTLVTSALRAHRIQPWRSFFKSRRMYSTGE